MSMGTSGANGIGSRKQGTVGAEDTGTWGHHLSSANGRDVSPGYSIQNEESVARLKSAGYGKENMIKSAAAAKPGYVPLRMQRQQSKDQALFD